jgi:hypothetical protein
MSAALELIRRASRPFKSFKATFGDGDFATTLDLKVRRESAAQSLDLSSAYNQAFADAENEITREGADIAGVRRSFARNSKERLAAFVVGADRLDYLQEASSELDDLPYHDERVKIRADELAEEQKKLLLLADDNEVMEAAVERRVHILATLRAQRAQAEARVLLTIFNSDETPFVTSVDELRETLTGADINNLVEESFNALIGETKDNPLKPARTKRSKEPTTLQSNSAAE